MAHAGNVFTLCELAFQSWTAPTCVTSMYGAAVAHPCSLSGPKSVQFMLAGAAVLPLRLGTMSAHALTCSIVCQHAAQALACPCRLSRSTC